MTVEPSFYISDSMDDEQAEAQSPVAVAGKVVSLRVLTSALRRGRRLWFSTMVLGLVAGLLVAFLLPPPAAVATTTLLLQQYPGSDPATDVAMLQTAGVAQLAVTQLHLHESPQNLLTQYGGTSLSSQVLQIQVAAPSVDEALRRANALAAAFLTFRGQQYERANQAVVSGLQSQLVNLSTQIEDLGNAASGTEATAIVAQRNEDLAEQGQLTQTIRNDMTNTTSVVDGSNVLARAIATGHSRFKRVVIDAGIGLLAGLVVGIGVVLLSAAVSDRVRRREDVALALGTPVELSLGPFRRPRWGAVRRLRRRLKRPDPDTRRLARHLRDKVDAGPSHLAVVSVDSLEAASLAVARCGAELTRAGSEVLVVDLSENGLVSKLLPVTDASTPVRFRRHLAAVRVFVPGGDRSADAPPPTADIVLVVATLDPSRGAERLRGWAGDAVVVTTAGRSRADKLRANAEMLRSAGVTLDSAILIGADADDYSPGYAGWGSVPVPDDRITGVPLVPHEP
jgi:capsular polysaccharide biosynthesis protein